MRKSVLLVFLIFSIIQDSYSGDYGVVRDGFPSWEERTVLVWTNRARSDPVEDLKGCNVCADKDCYKTPSKPLTYDYNLNRAARFHCANLVSCGGRLQHDSPCKLVTDISDRYLPNGSCDGSASCACEGGKCGCSSNCTSWYSRVSMFGTSPSGENAAYGYSDPVRIFYLWFWEPDSNPECGFRNTNGHRVNILNNSHSSIGVGNYQYYWTQDFASSSKYKRRLYSGTHYPKTGTNIEFRANWADLEGPSQATVVIDGILFDMEIERGSPTNGTFIYKAVLPGGCHKYYFLFKSSTGEIETFPDEGAYGLNCSDDFFPTRDSVDTGYFDIWFKEDIDYGDTFYSNAEVYLHDVEFKRDSYPDYVSKEESGCSCNFVE
ncbi:MAG: CAP domain-containing protein [Deltaproteobacteria bacterium]|nr:CAP domain-containing protein [Deltaproteobacteria bacterium]